MPFYIQPLREFLVRPAIPPALSRMTELAYNLLWSWEPIVRALFRRLDPTLWRECGYNPVLMLGRVSQSTLKKAFCVVRFFMHLKFEGKLIYTILLGPLLLAVLLTIALIPDIALGRHTAFNDMVGFFEALVGKNGQ